MSRLTVTLDTKPGQPELRTEDPAAIANALAPIGVRFERWELGAIDPDAPSEVILDAYRPYLDRLMGEGSAGAADVLRLRPGNEAYPAMRQKFLDEHIHTEDEVRFFVQGHGHFILHANGRVYDAQCTQGDLISVPSGLKHWFDAGEAPNATVLRIFTDTSGWTRTTPATRSAPASLPRPDLTEPPPAAILTDIEGTTTPIAFVRDVLFPFARARLPDVVAHGAADPIIAPLLAEVQSAAPDKPLLDMLLGWMDADAKATPLKALQGLIWAEGYESGAVRGRLYNDVAPALRRWHAAGRRLYVYSSGSVAAQRLLFGHSDAGDLTRLFDGFFDTAIGHKRDPDSYRRIAAAAGFAPEKILFLSDVEAELDAAEQSGLRVCQLVRPADGTLASTRHPWAADFSAVERSFQLG